MRRATLGPLHQIDLNRSLDGDRMSFGAPGATRKSFGAPGGTTKLTAAPSTNKKVATQSRTAAAAPGASFGPEQRRSSLFGGRPAAGLVDPRPLASKAWMTENVEALAKFLMDNGYPQRISSKVLLSPTGKDFQSILTFLLRMLDPTFALSTGPGKMEDEVHNVFKSLRYPFQISKTSLTAVGAQQSWPAVMGAIMWLLELLEYDSLVGAAEDASEEEPRAGEPAFFFNFVRVAYERFLAEDDAKIDEIKATVAAAFGEQHAAIEKDNAARRSDNARLRAEVEALRAQASKLPAARASRSDLEREVETLGDRVAEAERFLADITAKLAEKKGEVVARERELEHANAALTRVSGMVRSQELSLTDVEAIAKKKASLKDQMARMTAERRAAQEEAAVLQRQLALALDALRARVGEYEATSGRLQITPATAKYSAGIDFSLKVDEAFLEAVGPNGAVLSPEMMLMLGGAGGSMLDESTSAAGSSSAAGSAGGLGACTATSSALLGNDVKGIIKAGLREMKARFAKSSGEAQRALNECEEALARLGDAAKDAAKRNELTARQLREREGAVEAHRSELASGLAGTEQRIARMEAELTAARNELVAAQSSARELSPEVLHGMARQVEAHLATLARQRAHMHAIVARVGHAVLLHKGGVEDKLKGLAGAMAGKLEAVKLKPEPGTQPAAAAAANVSMAGGSGVDLGATLPGGVNSSGMMPAPHPRMSSRLSVMPRPAGAARYSIAQFGASVAAGGAGIPAATPAGDAGGAYRPSRMSLTVERAGSLADLLASESTGRIAPDVVARSLQM